MGAARAGRHNRRALRYPRNADIEEAADDEPEKENGDGHKVTVTQEGSEAQRRRRTGVLDG